MNLFLPCAKVSSFSALTCFAAFRFTPFHYTRSLRSFHSPLAPHSKSNSFSAFNKAICTGLHVLALLPTHNNGFCTWIIYKSLTHTRNCTSHDKPASFVSFRSVVAFALNPPHKRKWYALFFLRVNYPDASLLKSVRLKPVI